MQSKPSEHEQVSLLIPWYVNGTIDPGQRKLVERHLQCCVLCQEEAAAMRVLETGLKQAPSPAMVKGDFANLMAMVREAEAQQAVAIAPGSRSQFMRRTGLERLRSWWADSLDGLGTPSWLSAGGFAMASVMGVLVIVSQVAQLENAGSQASYHTLAQGGSMSMLSERDLTLVFAENTPETQVKALISSLQGEIMEGPSTLGAYRVRVHGEDGKPERIAETAKRLRANPIIVMAEPALPPTAGSH